MNSNTHTFHYHISLPLLLLLLCPKDHPRSWSRRRCARATLFSQLLYASFAWCGIWKPTKGTGCKQLSRRLNGTVIFILYTLFFSTVDEVMENPDQKLLYSSMLQPKPCPPLPLAHSQNTGQNLHHCMHSLILPTDASAPNKTLFIDCYSETCINCV